MAAALGGDDLSGSSMSSRRRSLASGSRRSWASASILEVLSAPGDGFQRSRREDDEEELRWAAIERLPTFERLRKAMIKQVLEDGKALHEEVDVTNLGIQERKRLIESMLKVIEEDNEKFLLRFRERTDRSLFSLFFLFPIKFSSCFVFFAILDLPQLKGFVGYKHFSC